MKEIKRNLDLLSKKLESVEDIRENETFIIAKHEKANLKELYEKYYRFLCDHAHNAGYILWERYITDKPENCRRDKKLNPSHILFSLMIMIQSLRLCAIQIYFYLNFDDDFLIKVQKECEQCSVLIKKKLEKM